MLGVAIAYRRTVSCAMSFGRADHRCAAAVHHLEAIEYATLEWVDWFNHCRLLEPIGNVPPAEPASAYYLQQSESALAA